MVSEAATGGDAESVAALGTARMSPGPATMATSRPSVRTSRAVPWMMSTACELQMPSPGLESTSRGMNLLRTIKPRRHSCSNCDSVRRCKTSNLGGAPEFSWLWRSVPPLAGSQLLRAGRRGWMVEPTVAECMMVRPGCATSAPMAPRMSGRPLV